MEFEWLLLLDLLSAGYSVRSARNSKSIIGRSLSSPSPPPPSSSSSCSPVTTAYISEVVGYLKVENELPCKLRVHLKDIQEVVPHDLVEVAIGQRPDVAARLSHGFVPAHIFAEDIVFACK